MRQDVLDKDTSAIHPLPTAKTGTEEAESIMCLREQKNIHENKDTQKVSNYAGHHQVNIGSSVGQAFTLYATV